MEAISIYILEDEVITQEILQNCLESFGYAVCGKEINALRALEDIKRLQPDLVMLDINVKGAHDGIWLGNQLEIPFIYLTAYNDKRTIQSALKTQPLSYLIKPFEDMEVFAAIELALEKTKTESHSDADKSLHNLGQDIILKDGKKHHKFNLSAVQFVKSEGKYIEIHLDDKRIVVRHSLSGFLSNFGADYLLKIHKSFAINLQKIQTFDASTVKIQGQEIPISRNFKKGFSERVKVYFK